MKIEIDNCVRGVWPSYVLDAWKGLTVEAHGPDEGKPESFLVAFSDMRDALSQAGKERARDYLVSHHREYGGPDVIKIPVKHCRRVG